MQQFLAILLLTSSIALMTLVPGGPIETRDFSHISFIVLTLFNLFLTVLGLGSLIQAYFVSRGNEWSIRNSVFTGGSYLLVYGLDLLSIFPVSPSPMPTLLLLIELIGIALALPILYLAIKLSQSAHTQFAMPVPTKASNLNSALLLLCLFAIFTVAIVAFATLSAIGK